MTSRVSTVAFQGIEAVLVDVQAQFVSGQVQFHVVGLPDKAVAESRERVRAALHSIGLALPGKRLVVNLSPADLPKEGSHFDLPIALALLSALGVIPPDFLMRYMVLGELALDGGILAIAGALPAAIAADNGFDGSVESHGAGWEFGDQRVSDGLQAVLEGNDWRDAGLAVGFLRFHSGHHAANERAVRALGGPEVREGVPHGKFFRVTGVDARDERIHGVVDQLLVEMRTHQLGEIDVGGTHTRPVQHLGK